MCSKDHIKAHIMAVTGSHGSGSCIFISSGCVCRLIRFLETGWRRVNIIKRLYIVTILDYKIFKKEDNAYSYRLLQVITWII